MSAELEVVEGTKMEHCESEVGNARGLNYEEIAEVMEIPLGTVRSRIFRARSRLREMLEPYVYES